MADLAKLLLVFVVLVVFLMRRANVGAVMLGASLLLGLLFQIDLAGLGRVVVASLSAAATLELILALALIMIMEKILHLEGALQRMIGAVRGLVGDSRVVMAALPALVGLIPSVGGAIFSAPMVEEVSQGSVASAERKAFINMWYRHIWEFVSPLYPALLLTAQVFGVSFGSMVLYLLPVPVIAVVVGWPVAFRGLGNRFSRAQHVEIGRHLRDLAAGLGPVAVVLGLVLVFGVSIALAVGLVVLGLLTVYRYSLRRALSLPRESISWNILLAAAGVLLFRDVLVASQAVQALTPFLVESGVPLRWLFFGLPFLMGVLTGSPQAFVGTAAPILIALMGTAAVRPSMVALAAFSGYSGCLISPAHMCLVLTTSYFKADMGKVLRMMIVPETAMVSLSLAYMALF